MKKFSIVCAAVLSCAVGAAAEIEIESAIFGGLEARSIGPAVMSGRISALDAVDPDDDSLTIYVGSASGGVWKSDDGGIVYRPVFDDHTMSIGAVRIDPSDPETVWVGTGESWVRNTVSVGDGVYRSTDGGERWQHLGLGETEHVAELLVHPEDSGTAWVCAVGELWSANPQRGVFRTTDGGASWDKVLYVDDDTGCSDLAMTPDGETLYAGMWEVRRFPDFFESGGPGSGLYRSTDGGVSWQALESGLPEGNKGRIAVTVAPSKPEWVYTTVESESTALYRSEDGGDQFERMDDSLNVQIRPFYFGELKVDPTDHERVYKPAFTLTVSTDGGDTFSSMFGSGFSVGIHPDHHALWINPDDSEQLVIGTDGGVYISEDKGGHWRHVSNLPVSQFYQVAVDDEWPYNIYGGLQDNGSWMGPSRSANGIENRDWRNIGFGDGFWALPDPKDSNTLFVEYQGGQLMRVRRDTREIKRIQPVRLGDQDELRFNWNTPIEISQANPEVIYYGSQYLYRSDDDGESWETISPDLTSDDPEGQRQEQSGGLTIDNSTAENYTTIYAISESPLDGDLIWVGTDDGNLQLTRDGGDSWTNVVDNVAGVPERTWVSRVEASPHDQGTAFVTFDGHRSGDMSTYLYKTSDYGQSWQALHGEGIDGYAHVVRQDPVNPDLLFAGTEFGLYVSLDGGVNWARFTENLPRVAVHDIVIHPDEHDLVLGTHGRGVYIVDDITPLRNLTQAVIDSEVAMLPSRPSVMPLTRQLQNFGADDQFRAPNPSQAATIVYYLKKRHLFGDFYLEVYDGERLITRLPAGKRRGLNRVEWPMRFKAPKFPPSTSLVPGFLGPRVPEGEYTVKLVKGERTLESTVELVGDPRSPHSKTDRRMQQELALELYDLINDLTYTTDNLTATAGAARRHAQALQGEPARRLREYADELTAFRKSLAASREGAAITGEEKLREKLGNLYGNVTGYDGRPTRTQFQRRDALADKIDDALAEAGELLGARRDAINELLRENEREAIEIMGREEWNETEGMTGFSGRVAESFFHERLPRGLSTMRTGL